MLLHELTGRHSWFTPPLTLDLTLQELGHTGFLDALKREKLLDKYSTTAKVVVFVPQNANNSPLSLEDLKRHVIVGEFGYTPVLKIGKAYSSQSGAKLNFTQKNSEYSVNGVRIVQSNIILENGVMHVLGGVRLTYSRTLKWTS